MPERWEFVRSIDRILYLGSLPFFGNLAPRQLAILAEHATERHYRRKAILFHEGSPTPAIHLIVDGKVTVSRAGHDFRTFGPKDAVGVMGLLARTNEGVQAQARAGTTTLELCSDALFQVFEDHFDIFHHVLKAVCTLLIEERKLIADNAGYSSNVGPAVAWPAKPLNLIERLLLLSRTFPTVSGGIDALTGLCKQVQEVRLEAGEPLWRIGDRADSILLLAAGTLECETATGQKFRFGSRSGAGSLDTLAEGSRWFHATVGERIVGLRLSREAFLNTLEDHHELAVGFLTIFAGDTLGVFESRANLAEGAAAGDSGSFGIPT